VAVRVFIAFGATTLGDLELTVIVWARVVVTLRGRLLGDGKQRD